MPTTCYAYIEYSATWAPALPAIVPIGPLRAGRALNVDVLSVLPNLGTLSTVPSAQVTVSVLLDIANHILLSLIGSLRIEGVKGR
jgi:hypothetical protein